MHTILIVDDNPMIASVLSAKIESSGFAVQTAASRKEAEQIMGSGQDFFLAVLDMSLPDALNGEIIDLAVKHDIPSIAFTGTFSESMREKVLARNVLDYELKDNPQCMDGIVSMIQRLEKNQGVQILVVDDSILVRGLAAKYLSMCKFTMLEAEDGAKAAAILDENPDIKLIITDYAMPEMDGFEFITHVRRKKSKTELPIIGISTPGTSATTARFLKQGANDFLYKPFTNEELYSRVIHNLETVEAIGRLSELNNVKNTFLGIAAHDLRNPISGLRGLCKMLLSKQTGPLTETQEEYLIHMRDASSQMLALVNELLDVSLIEQGKLEIRRTPSPLHLLVQQSARLLGTLAERKNITLDLDVDALPDFPLDPSRLLQVIDNLVSNAIKFSPPDTTVTISLKQDRTSAVLVVKDEGPGLSEEDKIKLFGQFQKLSAKPTAGERSTGIGLAISKKIIKAHRGVISVNSTPGQGAEFFVRLPMR